jgi:hypothetical protein
MDGRVVDVEVDWHDSSLVVGESSVEVRELVRL